MKKLQNNFSDDGTRYSIKDPYKIALLLCMGAKIVDRNADDPNNIIFTLEHEKMPQLVNAIHSGQPHKYLQTNETADFIKAKSYAEFHKEVMEYIRDIRMNRRGK